MKVVFLQNLKKEGIDMLKGIDVSSWNKGIDYNRVKNNGIDFVIIRYILIKY